MEIEYEYRFNDDNPGDIVEALNTDTEYSMWELGDDGGIFILIQPTGIKVKIINQSINGCNSCSCNREISK